MVERRFADKDVAWILKHASELDHQAESGAHPEGLSASDLEEIAGEVGIDPKHISQAIEALDRVGYKEPKTTGASRGTAREIRSVPGRLSPETMEALVQRARLREYEGSRRDGLRLGVWGAAQRLIEREIRLEPTPQRTLVHVEERLPQALRTRATTFPSITAAATGLGLGILALGGSIASIFIAGILGAAWWLLGDLVFQRLVSKSRARARDAADRLAEEATLALTESPATKAELTDEVVSADIPPPPTN